MIRDSKYYVKNLKNVTRSTIAKTDKTWTGQKVNPIEKLLQIERLDTHVAIQLSLQHAFGLRMKEAALLKPHGADKGSTLFVGWGTKGGRDRTIAIKTDYQRAVLNKAKEMVLAKNGSMIPEDKNFKEWKNHYYYICHKAGISRKEGITSHGLRHERLNEIYKEVTGKESPIRGGSKVSEELDSYARQEIAEVAGHCRESIASHYIGKEED